MLVLVLPLRRLPCNNGGGGESGLTVLRIELVAVDDTCLILWCG